MARSLYDILNRHDCLWCGTWHCRNCGWLRQYAARNKAQSCHECGGTDGNYYPIQHTSKYIADRHQDLAGSQRWARLPVD